MSKEFTIEQMESLMKAVADNNIGEFLFENDGVRLKIKGRQAETQVVSAPAAPVAVVAAACAQSEAVPAVAAKDTATYITSPIVGTFYAASAPDKPPFVKAGQQVNKGDVVFIIESMKVMNEVLAETSGVVAEIMVEDGAPVEYGQPILRLE